MYITPGGIRVPAAASLCCSCLPSEICVTVMCEYTGESSTVLVPMNCSLSDPYFTGALYQTTIPLGGQQIDVELGLEADDYWNNCYFVARSVALGLDGTWQNTGRLIDDTVRAAPDKFCQTLLWHGAPVQWTGESGCGPVLLKASVAEYASITPRYPLCDAYGNPLPDTDPIKNFCCNCPCLCSCACVLIGYQGAAQEYPVCRNGLTWATSAYGGVGVELVRDYAGNCSLALLPGSISLASSPAEVPIGSLTTDNQCPDVSARFDAFDSSGNELIVEFNCQDCTGCSKIAACCGDMVPRIVHATINTSDPDCACVDGLVVPLIYDRMQAAWVGTSPHGFCGHGVTLTMACSGNSLAMAIIADPCTVQSASDGSYNTCYPLSCTFTFLLGGIDCCYSVSGAHTITVTVVE